MSEQSVAVVLSGCGVVDGAEITEAVGLLIALSQAGIPYVCYAPDRPQMHVFDHAKGEDGDGARNILTESARIARGKIAPLSRLKASEHAAVLFPGGFGAAKNLSTFATDGRDARLYDDVRTVALDFILEQKPLLALCAAPLVLALAARDAGIQGAKLTVGTHAEGAALVEALEAWGQTHVETPVDAACVDEAHRFVTAPAYMYGAATPAEVFASCQAAVAALKPLLH
ncbi:enhancing lycopene biosynthesis protein 2 [Crenobacter luteus]|uniref:isoprenoid biosynthesis glyoxalase ElbB n=1 Tax=Crenobacter luteus TaxID=1452487 RepID=UPI0010439D64|nr:isoprenoid biosynthesis glyoxalase ElbB [Crenobacter luteus]TCP11201.1 enhancing lycopene biosynthesis protein 2 [Crenobacter luteus]